MKKINDMEKNMYTSKFVFWCQNIWTLIVIGFGILFLAKCEWSFLLSIPICIIVAFILWRIGFGIISLMDYNHRMAAKYNIRIENIPIYYSIFDEMVKKEEQGIDTSGIPNGITDAQEWLRFCQWQIEKEFKRKDD